MKLHSHYCQDPHCPSRWDDDGCANMPREERRPKVGDRVKLWPRKNRMRMDNEGWIMGEIIIGSVGKDVFSVHDPLREMSWERRYFADRGVTWDFADEEPADIVIRAFDTAHALGLDIGRAVALKILDKNIT